MSEWFKEHDWKSCDGGESSGGSNPLLCAKSNPTEPCEWDRLGLFYIMRMI